MKKALRIAALALLTMGMVACDPTEDDNNGNNGNNGNNVNDSTPTNPTIPASPTEGQWVDLGLPSGLMWYSVNIGSTTPEGFGDYYAWGETQPKNFYSWTNYAYGSSDDKITKYCNSSEWGLNGFSDNLTTLQPSDDVATQVLGSGARIPTREEWQELLDNTQSNWTVRNGVYGRLFTADNLNTLFIPAAGNRYGSSLNRDGLDGDYWSSSLDVVAPCFAWNYHFGEVLNDVYDGNNRCDGYTIRAVRPADKK